MTLRRRLSESEKARISAYLGIFNALVAATFAAMYTMKDQSLQLVSLARSHGGAGNILHLTVSLVITAILVTISLALYVVVLLHQCLVWLFAPFLLVNASFFTLHPHPPLSPTFKRRLSGDSLSSQETSITLPEPHTPVGTNALQIDARPLIDLSARSSQVGDTPPSREILLPAVLSPTQLQLRSLSPAFDQSMQQVKEREIEEILQPSSSRPTMPSSLSAILSKRSAFAPLMGNAFGRPARPERDMSTVSYPDINGNSGDLTEEEVEEDTMMKGQVYRSDSEVDSQGDLRNTDSDDGFDGPAGQSFELTKLTKDDIPYTSSPSHIAGAIMSEPESIDVLDPESRQASMSMPVPPPSRITTLAAPPSASSPRDIFSPTPTAFPKPTQGLPFAYPFLREQLEQRLASEPTDTISQWNRTVQAEKKAQDEDKIMEPTPYPSPPFTPPSSRPPTMYSSMALEIPPRDLSLEMLTTPDPFVVDRSPLSALAEDTQGEMETTERSAPATEEPESIAPVEEPAVQAPEPDIAAAEADSVAAVYEAAISEKADQPPASPLEHHSPVPPSYSEVENEIHMPTATRGILRNPLTVVEQEITPPRTISPVKSIGRGGLISGSRVAVDDFSDYTSAGWVAPSVAESVINTDVEPTLVSSGADEPTNVVGTVNDEPEVDMPHRHNSEATSGADDESTAPQAKKMDLKKRKKKTKKVARKGVSFEEVPFVIGSDREQEEDDGTETVLNDVAPSVIPVPNTFEIEEEEEVPTLIPNASTEAIRGSPVQTPASRAASLLAELSSPRSSSLDEMSDTSAILLPGEFTNKQVDHYGRWFARAHRDKSLPSIQLLRNQMKACSETELAGRLKLGSRADATKLSKTLVGDEMVKGVSSHGSVPVPPVRKGSYARRRR